jgi:hypothetical protein
VDGAQVRHDLAGTAGAVRVGCNKMCMWFVAVAVEGRMQVAHSGDLMGPGLATTAGGMISTLSAAVARR